jgi:zinc-ribbon domain
MFCQHCGKELPAGAGVCPACGAVVNLPPPPGAPLPPPPDSIEQIVHDLKQTSKQMASSAANLSRRMAAKAGTAAKDPTGSAKKAAHKVAEELDNVAKELDRILHDL